jgi:hypothetical protein
MMIEDGVVVTREYGMVFSWEICCEKVVVGGRLLSEGECRLSGVYEG